MPTNVVSCGFGINSVAMLIGLHEHHERPDVILFADPGGERAHTLAIIPLVRDWCLSVGFPDIVTVREAQTLEEDCLTRHALPGIAYGYKSCSEHFKARPQRRWLAQHGITDFRFYIGYDAAEYHRAKNPENRYPLIEWVWNRRLCREAIHRAGLPIPGKSACFFCPSMKKDEVLALARNEPELAARAIAMEQNADLKTIQGLGRRWNWERFLSGAEKQENMDSPEISCECFDGTD